MIFLQKHIDFLSGITHNVKTLFVSLLWRCRSWFSPVRAYIPLTKRNLNKKEGIIIVNQTVILCLLAGSAFFDLKNHRIPNVWILLGLAAGIYLHWEEPVWFLLRILAVTLLFFPLYHCRMIGAGDVKVMSLVCGYCKGTGSIYIIGIGFLTGAVWSLAKLLYYHSLKERLFYLAAYIQRTIRTKEIGEYYNPGRDGSRMTIPFAVCLFLGGFLYYAFFN
ncbi:prepilin peptidase [Clostridium sp. MCC353]|nr:prepilin peptidase [Clostridium sp. MCC353]